MFYIIILLPLLLFACIISAAIFQSKLPINTYHTIYSNIPQSFINYKIVQISDIHADNMANDILINNTVAEINKEKPDLILITGDIVTFQSKELYPFINNFSKLKAKDGIYVVLGNHDYGNYYPWKYNKSRKLNFESLLDCFTKLNWKLLNNESDWLIKNNDSILLAGTENYARGLKIYPNNANFNAAIKEAQKHHPIILMTHNPEYWEDSIRFSSSNIFLTLSGHTHGLQVGYRAKKNTVTLYELKSKYAAGLYKEKNKYLYINTGLGTVGFPFRIGLKPEISVFILEQEDR